mgnify:CR=1 FL=1
MFPLIPSEIDISYLSTIINLFTQNYCGYYLSPKIYPHPLSTVFSQTHSLWIILNLINMNHVDKLVNVLKLHVFFDTINLFLFVD